MSDVKGVLTFICTITAILLVVAALLLYAIGNVTDSSGAKGQGAMITCVIGAIAAGAAAVVVGNANFTYGS